ncbi:MAG: OmpA family protein [Actinomycetaceae bacterium]|nr:OmpA family protein [Actinomycetaceae bacterium]
MTSTSTKLRRPGALWHLFLPCVLISLSACTATLTGSGVEANGGESQDTANSAEQAIASDEGGVQSADIPTIPGYNVGEFPAIPLISVPDASVTGLNNSKFSFSATEKLRAIPGITLAPAVCDGPTVSPGTVIMSNSGGKAKTSVGSSAPGPEDGVGVYIDGPVIITKNADGSGAYMDDVVNLVIYGDGGGNYTNSETLEDIHVDPSGSGSYDNPLTGESITADGEGGGTYRFGSAIVTNNGDGSGSYIDDSLTIINDGEGSATITWEGGSATVSAKLLPTVPKVASFDPIPAVAPIQSCGVVISLRSEILFDSGAPQVNATADKQLQEVASVLTSLQVPKATISGHTDSLGEGSDSGELTRHRAEAVMAGLQKHGVTAEMNAEGKGDSQPVADNALEDGTDNPAGRQLNRRIDIYVPNF